jgi:hypothetical protein
MWTAHILDFRKIPDPIQQLAVLSDLFVGTFQYVTENADVDSLPKFEFEPESCRLTVSKCIRFSRHLT